MTAEPRAILTMNAFSGEAWDDPLLARRLANMGAAAVLFYDRPVEMVSGAGAWMTDRAGARHLDFYNNVPSLGHCHPAVVEAVREQVGRLNINSRYLVEVVDRYLEALKATLPAELSNVVLSCTGSEANDLALRLAECWTGRRGFVVTETAYHGNTAATTEISPSAWKKGGGSPRIRTVPAPDPAVYGEDLAGGFARAVAEAAAELEAEGHGFAGMIWDSIFSSDGVHADPAGFLKAAERAIHDAGGLLIADEVQPGFARTGTMWGFERHGLAPDIVTTGKPMGNGFPMAGTMTRPEILSRFVEDFGYFNTFGANPVAAAAGLAVLETIRAEGLVARSAAAGARLKADLEALAAHDPRIAGVRGAGLFLGVSLGREGAPDGALVRAVLAGLGRRRVLIGAAGRYGETLKLRPPLILSDAEASLFVEALADTLAETP
ncbi:MAG: aspartate aminotransferase family protein [Albimonas sp.]|uniref:aspartate aminotransferase family protein n=1 Tax=Albimonas sp. TaxID=1872425 RepID=UPI00405675BF